VFKSVLKVVPDSLHAFVSGGGRDRDDNRDSRRIQFNARRNVGNPWIHSNDL
jgi:hypothetical protein